ncbi:MAG: hypothetical protein M9962_14550 [Oligoflexia bacterium]|nr:hypothetical protein [Oligoflexia bacterium]
MILARYFTKPLILFLLIFAVTLFQQQSARAMGIDLLGEVSEPILGPAKEKMKKIIVYIWLQPYAGYAFGSSELTRTTAGGVVTPLNDVSTSGFL